MVQRFFERFASADHAFVRARFILKTQLEPEAVSPELDDPETEALVATAIEALEREIDRLNANGARRTAGSNNTGTHKALKK
ncbi:MAG: hypothetical protein JNK05_30970 [Myxococcales bacterium]|nr:hypothetical protein [Myxococcales bacterium]